MRDFLTFKKMITPIIIQILFWIGVVISIITGIILVGAGVSGGRGCAMMILMGLGAVFVGPLLIRIYCELIIVFFSINTNLTETKNLFQKQTEE